MLEPYRGRVYDPCCGSGGMFVQSEKFVESHGGRLGDIAIYGQESNNTTWRLAKMNLAVRGIDADIRWNNEGSFHKDELKDMRFDLILANPPFNVSDWGGDRLREDVRWKYGAPPVGNAICVNTGFRQTSRMPPCKLCCSRRKRFRPSGLLLRRSRVAVWPGPGVPGILIVDALDLLPPGVPVPEYEPARI